jgi:predicted ATPase
MLQSLHLQHFKSFIDQSIEIAPLTLLVGANASGKSNLLDAIRFLCGVGLDMSLTDALRGRWEGGRQIWPGIRGGIADASTQGQSKFTIHSVWREGAESISHTIGCETTAHVQLTGEWLLSDAVPGPYLFDTHAGTLDAQYGRDAGASIRVALKRTGKGKGLVQTHAAHHSLLGQVQLDRAVNPEVGRVRDALLAALRNMQFLDISPSRMRDYVPRHINVLGSEGENVSAMVWQACQEEEGKQDLIDWLTELCAPELEDIDFVETELGDVMLVFVEADGRRIPARSLSDGTLRFLGELMALRTAPEGSLLLIEEIENGLHPTRAHLLVEALESATQTRGIQVIATTHSPLILHALSPEALKSVVVMGRIRDQPGTVMRRLGDLPHFDEILDRRGIEHMFTTGWLERAL